MNTTYFPDRAVADARGAMLLALALSAAPAPAQTFAELEIRLRDHPDIASAQLEAAAFRESATAATAWPDPVVTVGIRNLPIDDPSFDRFLPTHKALGIRQQIPNASSLAARAARAGHQASAGQIEADARLARLRASLVSALAQRRSLLERAELANRRDRKYDEFVEVIGNEVEGGRPVVYRMARIDVERAEVARELAELTGELARVDARLVALVGLVPDTDPPSVDVPEWHGQPDAFFAVRLAAETVETARAGVDEAEAAYRPDWAVSLTYQQREAGGGGATFDGDDWVSADVSFTVPLFGKRSQAPKIRAANARLAAARSAHAGVQREARADWDSTLAAARAAAASIDVLETRISAIDAQQRAAMTNYEAGIGDYTQVLDAEISRLRFRAEIAAEHARRIHFLARAQSLLVSP